MKKVFQISLILCIGFSACKAKKEIVAKKDNKIGVQAIEKPTKEVAKEDAEYDHNQMPSETEGNVLAKRAIAKLSDSLVVRIQRTACFGRCPIYTASIYRGGYVDYIGEKWVQREGHFESKISQEKIDRLIEEANKIEFENLDNVYDNLNVTDLPSTIITVRLENGPKIVVNRYQGPEVLRGFEQLLDQTIEELTFSKFSRD
jgi:hypothetical protein